MAVHRPRRAMLLFVILTSVIACGDIETTSSGVLLLNATVQTTVGDPIEGADVILRQAADGSTIVVVTDSAGRVTLEVPVDTAYYLTVMAPGRLMPRVPVLVAGRENHSTGSVTFALPSADMEVSSPWEIWWSESLERLAVFETIRSETERAAVTWHQEILRHMEPGTSHAVIPEISENLEEVLEHLDLWMTDDDPEIRAFAGVQRVWLEVQSGFIDEFRPDQTVVVFDAAPVTSPYWGYYPNGLIFTLNRIAPDHGDIEQAAAALEACLQGNPDRRVQAEALASLVVIASIQDNNAEAGELIQRLNDEYGDVFDNEMQRTLLDQYGQSRVGQPVPHFAVTLLDGRGIDNEDLEGRYVLIHFWGTWCGPCKGDMPDLHEAYSRFGGPDFEILSLALNDSKDKVEAFRNGTWPMPWQHGVLPSGFESGAAKQLNVRAVPTTILVDPEGVIVATTATTRGPRLLETLEKHLGPTIS